jgi:hypothetical protein
MSEISARTDREFVEHWQRVGPLLDRIRARELREFNYAERRHEIDALLQIAAEHAVPRTSSGLVDLQRAFAQHSTVR